MKYEDVLRVGRAIHKLTGCKVPRTFRVARQNIWIMRFFEGFDEVQMVFWDTEDDDVALRRLSMLLFTFRKLWHPFFNPGKVVRAGGQKQ